MRLGPQLKGPGNWIDVGGAAILIFLDFVVHKVNFPSYNTHASRD
jgi:hypothetical protein